MIAIQFKNRRQAIADYLTMIGPPVISRVKMLQTALDHVQGIQVKEDAIDHEKYRVVTRKIFNAVLIDKNKLPEADFNLGAYETTVKKHLANSLNQLGTLNLIGLSALVKSLLAYNASRLKKLLVCPPGDLATMNSDLLSTHGITSTLDRNILKFAFDYTNYNVDIGYPIRQFFRKEDMVVVCPYCNIVEADYSETPEGEVATLHFLDHFFDKATSPLLSYSMFNLVPSDVICNGTNKGTINFHDDYHQNPHANGFHKDLVFEPVTGKINEPIKEIIPKIIPPFGDKVYKKMIGNEKAILQSAKEGNINVFKILTKYNRKHVLEDAAETLKKMSDLITTRASLKHFLQRMKLTNNLDNYKLWYQNEFSKPFDEADFNTRPYAKLYRDLHDYVMNEDKEKINDDIRKYIA